MQILKPAERPTVSAWAQKLEPKFSESEKAEVKSQPAPATSTVLKKRKRKNHAARPKHNHNHHRKSRPASRNQNTNFSDHSDPDQIFWYWPIWPETKMGPDSIVESTAPSPRSPLDPASAKVLQPWSPSFISRRSPKFVLAGSQLDELVVRQLAYYFSRENLLKDVHFRRMFSPEDGTVALSEMIRFSKMKGLLGRDVAKLVEIARLCDFVELFEDSGDITKSRVRVPGWENWIRGLNTRW